MPAGRSTHTSRAEKGAVALVVAAVLALAAFRATFGVSLYDDSHYATVALRLAQGARLFADEMSVQSLGLLPSAALAWIWLHFRGTEGLVPALRLSYVALAAVVGGLAYHEFRRSFRPTISAIPVVIVLLCPPFNLLAPSYNLMATLGLLAATALAHRAWRDGSSAAAVATGVALAFASITYPPLGLAALVFIASFLGLTRDRRLAIWLLGACAITAGAFVLALLSVVSAAEIREGLAYASANVYGLTSPIDKMGLTLARVWNSLSVPVLWPMWITAVVASLPWLPKRLRASLLFALAPLAVVPSIQLVASRQRVFGVTASAWLVTFVLAALVPVTIWAAGSKRREIVGLLVLTIPCSVVGFLTVVYSTDSGWLRAVPVIGLTPVAVAILVAWASALVDLWGEGALRMGSLIVVVIAMSMLWTTTIDDGSPLAMRTTIDRGAYSGMHVAATRKRELLGFEAAAARWVNPSDRVTFYGERQAYLLSGGRIYTNAVWLYPSPSDRVTLEYFAAHGGLPDVVFTDQFAMRLHDLMPYAQGAKRDPFIAVVVRDYKLVGVADDFGIWIRKQ